MAAAQAARTTVIFDETMIDLSLDGPVKSYEFDEPAEGLVRPKCFVEQFLHLVMRLVQIHGQLFLDDVAFFFEFSGIER